jgi:hypothetical protein
MVGRGGVAGSVSGPGSPGLAIFGTALGSDLVPDRHAPITKFAGTSSRRPTWSVAGPCQASAPSSRQDRHTQAGEFTFAGVLPLLPLLQVSLEEDFKYFISTAFIAFYSDIMM